MKKSCDICHGMIVSGGGESAIKVVIVIACLLFVITTPITMILSSRTKRTLRKCNIHSGPVSEGFNTEQENCWEMEVVPPEELEMKESTLPNS